MGPRVDPAGGKTVDLGTPALDDQIIDVLNDMRMTPKGRVAELEKTFSGLSQEDKDALYDRLKTKDRKDPLSRAFHYRFDRWTINHKLLPALNPNHQPPGEDKQIKSTPENSGKSADRVGEKKAEGTARHAELETKMRASRFEQSIKSFIQDSYDGKTAIEGLHKLQILEKASKEEIKQLIMGAEEWHPENRKVLDTYLTQSPELAKRIGQDLSPQDQVKVIDRIFDASVSDNPADKARRDKVLESWMKNSNAVNLVLDKAKNWDSIAIQIGEQMKKEDTSVFDKLTPDHKVGVFGMAIDATKDFSADEAKAMSGIFGTMTPKEKNSLIDALQTSEDSESMLKFLQMAAPDIDGTFLKGLNKDNLRFMSKTLQVLAKTAEFEKNGVTASLYLKKANYLDGIAEELRK